MTISRLSLPSPFPKEVSFCGLDKVPDNFRLFPEEARLIVDSCSEKRKREFMLGRCAARMALEGLSSEDFPILQGASGEPLWPRGVIGSISHSNEVAVAASVKIGRWRALGLDIENLERKRNPRIFDKILTENEKNWVFAEQEGSLIRGLKIFSAKEATYKAYFQGLDIKFTWLDVELHPTKDENVLEGRVVSQGHAKSLEGCGVQSGSNFKVHSIKNRSLIISGILV